LGDIEGLSATCRVSFVEGLSIDASGKPVDEYAKNLLEDRIRLLLPLDLPEPLALEGGGGVAVVQLIHKLSGDVDQGLLRVLKAAFLDDKLEFHGHLASLAEPRCFAAGLRVVFRHDWVLYSKRPFGGPEHALRYLGAYTHRVGICNSRLVALSDEQEQCAA
jgi:hypothetical protein